MKQRIAELTSLEELFEDVFAAGYMLRFTEAEFSSENVAFILAVRNFQRLALESSSNSDAKTLAKAIKKEHIDVSTRAARTSPAPSRDHAPARPPLPERPRASSVGVAGRC